MDAAIKERWVKALRSGDYKKGIGKLHKVTTNRITGENEDLYCCLGVLCEIAVQDKVIGPCVPDLDVTDPAAHRIYKYNGSSGFLPIKVQEWAGLDNNNPEAWGESLASLNDTGESFPAIADIIEERL